MDDAQRRRFSRIRFHGDARLLIDDAEHPCEVVDLSLRGALVDATLQPAPALGTRCLLELRLGEGVAVRMEGDIAHRAERRIGLACREIDLDSLIHLRRLLALNFGDAAMIERELSALLGG